MDIVLLDRIDNKRDDLARIPSSSAALRRIKKEAYYQHIYHTAGIEGNTMTLAQTRMILETRLSVGGKWRCILSYTFFEVFFISIVLLLFFTLQIVYYF